MKNTVQNINYKIGCVTCGFIVADAISDIFISIGTRVSYSVGAVKKIFIHVEICKRKERYFVFCYFGFG